jgi:signal transduction histidine kinase
MRNCSDARGDYNSGMLHEFLAANRSEILNRSRAKLSDRNAPTPTVSELKNGLPLFLDQLVAILRAPKGSTAGANDIVSAGATVHGGELLQMGLTVGQVVQDYGSICQSVTELADERDIVITVDEFHTFNGCLDRATAQAVTAFERQRDRTVESRGAAQLGFLAHEMRNLLSTSMLTFDVLARGTVGIKGTTGAMHGQSLRRMRDLIDRTLSEVRLGAEIQKSERVIVARLVEEIAIGATLDAKEHDKELTIEAGPYDMAVDADPQILASVVANLVQNAFKFTRPHGRVTIRALSRSDRAVIEVQDECGGLPPGNPQELFLPFEQRTGDKTGLGLGLSICLRGAKACGGEIHVRDLPGAGCVFTVDLPMALSVA